MNNCKYKTIKRFLENPNVIVNSLIDCEPMYSVDIGKKRSLIWHYKLIPYQFSSPYTTKFIKYFVNIRITCNIRYNKVYYTTVYIYVNDSIKIETEF